MIEASVGAKAPNQEPFTAQDYLKIRELSGYSIGEILAEDPDLQVNRFCKVARNEHSLHGDSTFIRSSLDAAVEAASHIKPEKEINGDGTYVEGADDVLAYLRIAKVANLTGQETEYVTGLIDTAVDKVATYDEYPTMQAKLLNRIAAVAHNVEPGSERVKTLAERIFGIYDAHPQAVPTGGWNRALDEKLTIAGNLGFGSEYQMGMIAGAREEAMAAETEGERVKGLLRVAQARAPGVELTLEDRLVDLKAAQAEAVKERTAQFCVADLIDIADAARRMGQAHSYVHALLEQALGHVPSIADHDYEYALERIQEIIVASTDEDNRELPDRRIRLTGLYMGVHIVKRMGEDKDVSARDQHKMLNQVLAGAEEETAFLDAVGVERKPFSFVFNPALATKKAVAGLDRLLTE